MNFITGRQKINVHFAKGLDKETIHFKFLSNPLAQEK
jgi:hypothetical protein